MGAEQNKGDECDQSGWFRFKNSEADWFLYGIYIPFFVIIYLFTGILVLKHLFRMAKDKKYLYLLVILSLLAYLIIPTLPVANGPRIRLPIDWLVILLAIIEFYYSLDIYASRFVTASPLK